MSTMPAILLAPLLLEDQNLGATDPIQQRPFDSDALQDGATDPDIRLFTDHQNAIELDLATPRAGFGHQLDIDEVAWLDAILLATCFNYCVHSAYSYSGPTLAWKAEATTIL
jgi:hypothetical protein